MSKSRKLHELITEQETNPTMLQTASADKRGEFQKGDEEGDDEDDDNGEIQPVLCHISLTGFPGGSDTFEAAAKFCYGVKIELTSSNVAPLRCAAEFLAMAEDYSEDNLISRTDKFLSQYVLRSLKESVRTLKSCESLMPMAETLNIPKKCIESIASRASSVDPSLFGWPVSDGGGGGEARVSSIQILWNGIDAAARRKGTRTTNGKDSSWFEDLSLLSLPLFSRLISAMRSGDVSADIIESCVMCYAKRSIPGISRSSRKPLSSASSSSVASETEQRELLETIVANLPLGKSSRPSAATRFLFGLLRTANILNASESCRAALEKKIGSHLEQATLDDLLIPSYSYLKETLYDVDCVERILGYYLEGAEERSPGMMLVGKLIDGYLSEIASDANLKPEKFCELAMALPEHARLFDDGLYRAVDVFLKAHPRISEDEREKITGVIECQKLTLEACTHAAQNDRLPLRAVVQVLFFEQLQLRHAIAGSLSAADGVHPDSPGSSAIRREQDEDYEEYAAAPSPSAGRAAPTPPARGWRSAAVRENQVLRLDMDSMRTRVQELERECTNMKKVIEKIDKVGTAAAMGAGGGGWTTSFAKKLGCKYKTQVRDSHEPTVADTKKGRQRHHHHHGRHHQHGKLE